MVVALCLSTTSISLSHSSAQARGVGPRTLFPTTVVVVVPKYGYALGPVRARLSHSEIDVVRRLQQASLASPTVSENATDSAIFLTEQTASSSQTIQLGKKAMRMAGEILASDLNGQPRRTFVIIGRTQKYLVDTVQSVGCVPNLDDIGGSFLMGATICNRQVIVINLTGYLFLRNSGQSLTSEMEAWPEPRIGAISYLIADRNIAGLAHEWVHVARSYISRGLIPDNEPAWFREGLAEVVGGMARVRASSNRMTYQDFHVIRLRKFSNWPSQCRKTLDEYRGNSSQVGGCEYLRGAVALELLIANYGGIRKVVRLYEDLRNTADFFKSFQRVYGMSIASFEHRADTYATYIAQAAIVRR